VLDDDCITEMSVHYGRSRQEVKDLLACDRSCWLGLI
jgi:hypothetical protein